MPLPEFKIDLNDPAVRLGLAFGGGTIRDLLPRLGFLKETDPENLDGCWLGGVEIICRGFKWMMYEAVIVESIINSRHPLSFETTIGICVLGMIGWQILNLRNSHEIIP